MMKFPEKNAKLLTIDHKSNPRASTIRRTLYPFSNCLTKRGPLFVRAQDVIAHIRRLVVLLYERVHETTEGILQVDRVRRQIRLARRTPLHWEPATEHFLKTSMKANLKHLWLNSPYWNFSARRAFVYSSFNDCKWFLLLNQLPQGLAMCPL